LQKETREILPGFFPGFFVPGFAFHDLAHTAFAHHVHQRSIQVEEKDAQRAYLRGFSTSTQAERWTPARPIGQKCSAEPQRRLENQLVMSKSMPLKV
jgi:hypothetical protein